MKCVVANKVPPLQHGDPAEKLSERVGRAGWSPQKRIRYASNELRATVVDDGMNQLWAKGSKLSTIMCLLKWILLWPQSNAPYCTTYTACCSYSLLWQCLYFIYYCWSWNTFHCSQLGWDKTIKLVADKLNFITAEHSTVILTCPWKQCHLSERHERTNLCSNVLMLMFYINVLYSWRQCCL